MDEFHREFLIEIKNVIKSVRSYQVYIMRIAVQM